MADLTALCELVQKGKMNEVKEGVNAALDEGVSADDILQKGLVEAMRIMGERMQQGKAYVPEVLIAARAMSAGLDILEPKLVEAGVEPKGILLIGTVKGDLHDIGKNLVAMMFKGAGFKVVDLGVDCSAEKFVEKAKECNPDVIALSALLTTTMVNMKGIVTAIKDAGIKAIVEVGGAPVTEAFAKEIGADAYADDAPGAVNVCLEILEKGA